MPINLQGSGNIAEGWGAPPQLSAPNIGGLVEAILRNRLARDKMTQESIADTIKNVREERQSGEYLDAMKAAGLIPQDYDAGGLGGAKLGTSLAQMIQHQQEFQAREEHRRAMEARIGGRGRGGGGGGSEATQVEAPEDYYGLHNAPGIPTTKTINGIVHVKDTHGRWKPGPKWMQPSGSESPKLSPTEKGWAAPEIPGLSVNINAPDDTIPLAPDVPPMPEPQGTPQSAPADKNLAQGYGTDATSMSSDDVRAAYRAGKMTIEEAKARLKAMGFSD